MTSELADQADHFEQLHRDRADPWDVTSSWYERRKYAITMSCLPREHYHRAWEPGCSIGGLTVQLAERAGVVDASDFSETALTAARSATAQLPGVTIRRSALPQPPPGSGYDLIMLSEVLYYLSGSDRELTLRAAEAAATPDADLVVVHWRHHPEDAWASGADVNAAVRARPGWTPLAQHEEPDFVLDVLTRSPG